MAGVTITVRKNGPYLVSGPVEVRDADGNLYPARETVALCRCGASTKKPFCDGTHSKVGFQAAEENRMPSADPDEAARILAFLARLAEHDAMLPPPPPGGSGLGSNRQSDPE